MDKLKYYTGIGSRKTPINILILMKNIASELEHSFILRSGHAIGADRAFESGIMNNNNKEIYLANDVCNRAMQYAEKFHPSWNSMNLYGKKLHARNVYQILGKDLDTPSEFVLCWTKDFCESHETRSIRTGGTGTAISIASHFNIPVINMSRQNWQERLIKLL